MIKQKFICRFLDRCPNGAIYVAMCFICRSIEANGCAMLNTASFAIMASTFPNNVGQAIVSLSQSYQFHFKLSEIRDCQLCGLSIFFTITYFFFALPCFKWLVCVAGNFRNICWSRNGTGTIHWRRFIWGKFYLYLPAT